MPGFEASALGTAGGRGVWSEEGTRQGIEGIAAPALSTNVCSSAKSISLLQATILAQGVLPGAARSAAAPHDVHLKWS